jgi:acyl-CoA synthetase (AMP-forming)/AMP-acid ligase II
MREIAERATATAGVLHRTGLLRGDSPLAAARGLRQMRRWGAGLAGAIASHGARHPDRVALIDELGPETYGELDERTDRLANALAGAGVRPGERAGLLCRDHRFFVEGAVAVNKTGADLVLLNTSFSGPQLRDVCAAEGVSLVIHDDEFTPLAGDVDARRVLAWREPGADGDTVDALVRAGSPAPPPAPGEPGRMILLTSGTTGRPKGARRPPDTPLDAIVGFLEAVPLRARTRHFVAAPMFHAWGFAHFGLCILLGMQMVSRRRFDPESTLATIDRFRPRSVAMVPVMAQRILALPEEVRARYDCSSVEVVALGGSAIPGDLAPRFMDAFGDCAYNTYGSTEVAIVSIAGPADLRADPATAGRLVRGVDVRLMDPGGREVAEGEPGRIFVRATASFDGYTDGRTKERIGEYMSSGDMGSFDRDGRLRIEGRDDDMIVSGGENVFPTEVEDLIARLDGVEEVAVIGVADDEFGQRLKAFVVRGDGHELGERDVQDAVRASLARFKVPREVVFLEALPRTSTGKILKRELSG